METPSFTLTKIGKKRLKTLGGKGNGLSLLSSKKFRVPTTFCFTSKDLLQLLNGLSTFQNLLLFSSKWPADFGPAHSAYLAFHDELLSLPRPRHWPDVFAKLKTEFGVERPWIFRSSAGIEDALHASFAGAFESHSVTPDADLTWTAFKKVLASFYKISSLQRLLSEGICPANLEPAIIVQPLISAQISGVCFSHDPQNVFQESGVVEWTQGYGDKLAQGEVKTSFAREDASNSPKDLKAFWNELWHQVHGLKKLFQIPIDVEWAWDGNKIWILQVRPIVSDEAPYALAVSRGKIFSRELTLERFPKPLTPMGWSILRDSLITNLKTLKKYFGISVVSPEEMAISIRGIIYSDPQFLKQRGNTKIIWGKWISPLRPFAFQLIAAALRKTFRHLRQKPKARVNALFKLELLDIFLSSTIDNLNSGWEKHCTTYQNRNKTFHSQILKDGTPTTGIELLQKLNSFSPISVGFMEPDLAIYVLKTVTYEILQKLCKEYQLLNAEFLRLATAFENKTLELKSALKSLGAQLATDPGIDLFLKDCSSDFLTPHNQERWKSFLEEFGHCRTSWEVAEPGWSERPQQLIPWIKSSFNNHEKSGDSQDFITIYIGASEIFEKMIQEVQKDFGTRAAVLVQKWKQRLLQSMKMDEDHHFFAGMLLDTSRTLLLQVGNLLTLQNIIQKPEDVFFLRFSEVKNILISKTHFNHKFLIQKREAEWIRSKASQAPFSLGESSPKMLQTLDSKNKNLICGIGVSQGITEGYIQFIESMDDLDDLTQDKILVTTSPNPSFVGAYSLCSGIISEVGGPLSHGFIAAREIGIPCVSNIPDIRSRFHNGMKVRIDGTLGSIEILGASL